MELNAFLFASFLSITITWKNYENESQHWVFNG